MRWMTVFLIALIPCPLWAEEPAHVWPGLNVAGLSAVKVIDRAGDETTGRLLKIGPDSLTLLVSGVERRIEAARVKRIERRGDSLRNGALIGAGVGTAMGFIAAGISDCAGRYPGGNCPGMRAAVFLTSLGVYTAIGTAIDALIVGHTTLYVAPPDASARSRARPSEVVNRARAGVDVRFTW